jgi:hypothetical protein
MYANGKASTLRQQAKDLLYETLGLSESYCSEIVDKMADYLVSIAILESVQQTSDPYED